MVRRGEKPVLLIYRKAERIRNEFINLFLTKLGSYDEVLSGVDVFLCVTGTGGWILCAVAKSEVTPSLPQRNLHRPDSFSYNDFHHAPVA